MFQFLEYKNVARNNWYDTKWLSPLECLHQKNHDTQEGLWNPQGTNNLFSLFFGQWEDCIKPYFSFQKKIFTDNYNYQVIWPLTNVKIF